MALFFVGKTCCACCGKIVNSAEEWIGFPAFLRSDHPLSKYSDASFHKSCFEIWPPRAEFERVLFRHQQIWDSRPRNLKTIQEIEAWGKEAFKEFLGPPSSTGD